MPDENNINETLSKLDSKTQELILKRRKEKEEKVLTEKTKEAIIHKIILEEYNPNKVKEE